MNSDPPDSFLGSSLPFSLLEPAPLALIAVVRLGLVRSTSQGVLMKGSWIRGAERRFVLLIMLAVLTAVVSAGGTASGATTPTLSRGTAAGVRAFAAPAARDPHGTAVSAPPTEAADAPTAAPVVANTDVDIPSPTGRPWRIRGILSEACTCSVPCTCNFGGGPSPEHFCHAVFSLDIKNGLYGSTSLNGLHLACGNGARGSVWYLDEKASASQVAALKAIASTINAKLVAYWKGIDPKIVEDPQFTQLGFKTAKIVQTANARGNFLKIGEYGGFDSEFLLGIDGKTPIIVENNWSWNIKHGVKGKTGRLTYADEYGNSIDTRSTNSNHGRFDWSDSTPIYLR